MKCGEGLQGVTNSILWSGLLTYVTDLRQPVIIVGDFNAEPREFMNTTVGGKMQVTVLATGAETINTGAELDWALVSSELVADMTISADWNVPYKPNCQLHFQLHRNHQQVAVQQLFENNPIPRLEQPRFHWPMIEQQIATECSSLLAGRTARCFGSPNWGLVQPTGEICIAGPEQPQARARHETGADPEASTGCLQTLVMETRGSVILGAG